jgi:hypothetical protein
MSSYRRNITIDSLRSALRSARRSEQLAICFAAKRSSIDSCEGSQRMSRGTSGYRTSACNCWVSLRVTQKVPPRQALERGEIYRRGKIPLPGTSFSLLIR